MKRLPDSFAVLGVVFRMERSDEPQLTDDQYTAKLPDGRELCVQISAGVPSAYYSPKLWDPQKHIMKYFGPVAGCESLEEAQKILAETIREIFKGS